MFRLLRRWWRPDDPTQRREYVTWPRYVGRWRSDTRATSPSGRWSGTGFTRRCSTAHPPSTCTRSSAGRATRSTKSGGTSPTTRRGWGGGRDRVHRSRSRGGSTRFPRLFRAVPECQGRSAGRVAGARGPEPPRGRERMALGLFRLAARSRPHWEGTPYQAEQQRRGR